MSSALNHMRFAILLSLTFVVTVGGCQFAPETNQWSKELLFGKEVAEVPDRMMVIWTDTILHQPQQPGVRGFGGRIYFFKGSDDEPIEVDGGLAVYAFDASMSMAKGTKPERKFVFTADQFGQFLSHTDMGPSYSVWIPWDQVGGLSRQLSLVTRFEGREGGVVISDPAIKLLPGLENPQDENRSTPSGSVVRASYTEPSTVTGGANAVRDGSVLARWNDANQWDSPPLDSAPSQGVSRDVMTIDLPPSFNRHLLGAEQDGEASHAKPAGNEAANGIARPLAESDSTLDVTFSPQRDQVDSMPRVGQRYPFRTNLGIAKSEDEAETLQGGVEPYGSSGHRRTSPLKAGWLKQLPASPRSGFPR